MSAEAGSGTAGVPSGTGVESALGAQGTGALHKYQDLVVGSRSTSRLLLHEAVVTLTSALPGALGLVLRRLTYPWLLGSVGANPTFGHGISLRHPAKIRIGDGVIVDDLVVLDAKGTGNQGIQIGDNVFLGRGTILSCKDGDIILGDHVNIGFYSEVFSGSRVEIGAHGLFAAYSYVVGGGHAFDRPGVPVIEQERRSTGVTLGPNVWLGTGAKVLDGVTIGRDVVVGANAVVAEDLPDGVIAAGVPARVVRRREDGDG